jgi:hypothetical protein
MSILEIIRESVKVHRYRRDECLASGIHTECRNLYGTSDAEYMTASIFLYPLYLVFLSLLSLTPLWRPYMTIRANANSR